MVSVLIAALLMASPDPGPTAQPGQAAAVASKTQSAKKADGDKLVCWDEKPTGSHVSRRLCVAPEELEANRQAFKDSVAASRFYVPFGGTASRP